MYICRYVYGNKNVFAEKQKKQNKKKTINSHVLYYAQLCMLVIAERCISECT